MGTPLALENSTVNISGSGTLSFGSLTAGTLGGLTGPGGLVLGNTASAAVSLSVGNNNANTTFSGSMTGPGSLTKMGTGTLWLSGSNGIAGNFYVGGGGTVSVNGSMSSGTTIIGGSFGGPAVGTVAVPTGGTLAASLVTNNNMRTTAALDLNGGLLLANTTNGNWFQGVTVVAGTGGANINTSSYTMTVTSGVITGPGSLTKYGSGTLALDSSNAYTGGTVINNGILQAYGELALGPVPSSFVPNNITLNGGLLRDSFQNQGLNLSANRGVFLGPNGGYLRAGWSNVTTVNGVISGSGPLTIASDGYGFSPPSEVYLANPANTYSGSTTIGSTVYNYHNLATLNAAKLANGGFPSSIGQSTSAASNLVFNPGSSGTAVLNYSGTGDSTDRLFTIASGTDTIINSSGTGPLNFTNPGVIAFTNTQVSTLILGGTYSGPTANTLAPRVTDNASLRTTLVVNGSLWSLTGSNNTYTGGTVLSGGTLQIARREPQRPAKQQPGRQRRQPDLRRRSHLARGSQFVGHRQHRAPGRQFQPGHVERGRQRRQQHLRRQPFGVGRTREGRQRPARAERQPGLQRRHDGLGGHARPGPHGAATRLQRHCRRLFRKQQQRHAGQRAILYHGLSAADPGHQLQRNQPVRYRPLQLQPQFDGRYTVSLWEEGTLASAASAHAGGPALFSTRNGANDDFDLQVNSAGLHGDIGTGSAYLTTSADATIALGSSWNMITVAVNTSGYAIYVNGSLVPGGTGSYSGTPVFLPSSSANVSLGSQEAGGASYGSGGYFNGAMSQVEVFNQRLSAAQIASLFSYSSSALNSTPNSILSAASPVSLAAGATLDLGSNQTVGSLSGAGTVRNSFPATTATLTIGGDGTNQTFSGTITGSLSLAKTGAGTETFSGVNAYTGSTTIDGGNLRYTSLAALPTERRDHDQHGRRPGGSGGLPERQRLALQRHHQQRLGWGHRPDLQQHRCERQLHDLARLQQPFLGGPGRGDLRRDHHPRHGRLLPRRRRRNVDPYERPEGHSQSSDVPHGRRARARSSFMPRPPIPAIPRSPAACSTWAATL